MIKLKTLKQLVVLFKVTETREKKKLESCEAGFHSIISILKPSTIILYTDCLAGWIADTIHIKLRPHITMMDKICNYIKLRHFFADIPNATADNTTQSLTLAKAPQQNVYTHCEGIRLLWNGGAPAACTKKTLMLKLRSNCVFKNEFMYFLC
jgi:hypothetical protein